MGQLGGERPSGACKNTARELQVESVCGSHGDLGRGALYG